MRRIGRQLGGEGREREPRRGGRRGRRGRRRGRERWRRDGTRICLHALACHIAPRRYLLLRGIATSAAKKRWREPGGWRRVQARVCV